MKTSDQHVSLSDENRSKQIKQKKAAWRAALVSAAGSFAAEAAGTKTKVENTSSSGSVNTNFSGSSQSSSDVYNSYGSYSGSVDTNTNFGGNATTNYYGNSTTYTEERDGAAVYAAQQESAKQVNEMMNNANEARKKWNEDVGDDDDGDNKYIIGRRQKKG